MSDLVSKTACANEEAGRVEVEGHPCLQPGLQETVLTKQNDPVPRLHQNTQMLTLEICRSCWQAPG